MATKAKKKFAAAMTKTSLNMGATFDPSIILPFVTLLINFFMQNCGKKKTAREAASDELRKMWTVPKYEPPARFVKEMVKQGIKNKKEQRELFISALLTTISQDQEIVNNAIEEE